MGAPGQVPFRVSTQSPSAVTGLTGRARRYHVGPGSLPEPRRTGIPKTDAAQGWGWASSQARRSCAERVIRDRWNWREKRREGCEQSWDCGNPGRWDCAQITEQNPVRGRGQAFTKTSSGLHVDRLALLAYPMTIYSPPLRGYIPDHTTG